jgi:hypothetical protein
VHIKEIFVCASRRKFGVEQLYKIGSAVIYGMNEDAGGE